MRRVPAADQGTVADAAPGGSITNVVIRPFAAGLRRTRMLAALSGRDLRDGFVCLIRGRLRRGAGART
jgi:hypothetical protein